MLVNQSFAEQLKRNVLMVFSILIMVSALFYNTWRNEQSEYNQNIRQAGFEMLLHIAVLQRITYLAHFDKDTQAGNPRKGWVEILVLRDLSVLMPTLVQGKVQSLVDAWNENSTSLGSDDDWPVAKIDGSINELRQYVLKVLQALD